MLGVAVLHDDCPRERPTVRTSLVPPDAKPVLSDMVTMNCPSAFNGSWSVKLPVLELGTLTFLGVSSACGELEQQ